MSKPRQEIIKKKFSYLLFLNIYNKIIIKEYKQKYFLILYKKYFLRMIIFYNVIQFSYQFFIK